MKALIIDDTTQPRTIEVDGLKDMQRAVGGPIEPVSWLFDDEPAAYVNGEGKLDQEARPNRALFADRDSTGWFGPVSKGDLVDIAFGPMLFVGLDQETGESRDITDEEIERVLRRFGPSTVGTGMLAALCVREGVEVRPGDVGTLCYNTVNVWPSRDQALSFFGEAALNSEGAERDRYMNVLAGLSSGVALAVDFVSPRVAEVVRR